MSYRIGVDLGDQEILAGLVDSKGKVVKRVSVVTESDKGRDVVIENICKAISLLLNYKNFRKTPPIGIGIPGLIDHENGIVKKTQSLPFKKVELEKIVRYRFKTKVKIDNNANCFILGEFLYGAGEDTTNSVGFIVGTGVGGGIIINKELYRGDGQAGEFGQMTIKFNGLLARCGNDGSLEEYVSRRGMMRLAESFGMRKVESPEEIHSNALKNDLNSKSLFREVGVYLGIQIANVVNAFDPEKVIVGGDFADAWSFFGPHLKEEVKKRALFKPSVVKGRLGKQAIIIGAASLVK